MLKQTLVNHAEAIIDANNSFFREMDREVEDLIKEIEKQRALPESNVEQLSSAIARCRELQNHLRSHWNDHAMKLSELPKRAEQCFMEITNIYVQHEIGITE